MYLSGNRTTTLDIIKREEFANFVASYAAGTTTMTLETAAPKDKFIDGNVIYTVNPSSVEINNILYRQGLLHDGQETNLHDSKRLFDRVSTSILTIEDELSLTNSLVTINQFIQRAGNNFYGAILRSSDGKICMNPFHPLTAPLLLANYDHYDKRKYKAILYFYDNRDAADKENRTDRADMKLVEVSIDELIRTVTTTTTPITASAINVTVDEDLSQDRIVINGKVKRNINTLVSNNVVQGASNMLVAHQMLTRGVMVPYYGTSYLEFKLNESCRGAHISPFRSVNISRASGTRTERLQYNSVCTGNQNNRTLRGLRTLMHANLSSPYSTETILNGALAYADMCINKCLIMYKAAGILTDIEPIVIKTESLVDKYTTPEFIELYKTARTAFMTTLTKEVPISVVSEILRHIEGLLNESTVSNTTQTTDESQRITPTSRTRSRRPASDV